MIKQTLSWASPYNRSKILEALNEHQIVVGSSDTIVGLFAALSLQGKQALDRIKGRQKKPYIVLISGKEKLQYFSQIILTVAMSQLLDRCWPGPLTIIVTAQPDLPDWLCSPQKTIALRVPQHAGLLNLLQDIPGLFSTSANFSGTPFPRTIEAVDPAILNQCAYSITDQITKTGDNVPSTIIDCSATIPVLIREGAYTIEDLKQFGVAIPNR